VITYLNHTGLAVRLLINFGERSLKPHRVFPSPQATGHRVNYEWLFIPDWLKAEREPPSVREASVPHPCRALTPPSAPL